ncbi:MAG TPA: nitrogenase stabilizing/protective protein NifW [Aromatoleum sp.]|uniref:nitrogenase stabilizing/protective protein NifW n=1 Tax=Aromatoleum sp. TaxID=2307007 RepID=UPI002B4792B9|nr:nitrogenase stabilizing/protective protein NifW [Aromatoleum sp.]HJV25381.1 nitrogenase stabilizing/protective protein NifW [Aromatoleum sp.]
MSVLIDDLKALESAEAFLDYFALPYDPAVVRVSRLHILKRFYQYLAQQGGLESLSGEEARAACREMLARAYEDFVASSGVEQKVFKVFQTARGEHRVAVGGLRRAVSG